MAGHHHTEACTLLGVSAATLRRLAKGFEAAFEELPTDGAGGRVYPDHALDHMQDARELVKSRRVGTLEQAFKFLANGEFGGMALPQQEVAPVVLQELVGEIRSMRQALERLSEDNAALHATIKDQGEQLKALEAPKEDDRTYNAEMEKVFAEMEKRNRYLEGELRRRDEQPQARWPWWKVWGKKERTSS